MRGPSEDRDPPGCITIAAMAGVKVIASEPQEQLSDRLCEKNAVALPPVGPLTAAAVAGIAPGVMNHSLAYGLRLGGQVSARMSWS